MNQIEIKYNLDDFTIPGLDYIKNKFKNVTYLIINNSTKTSERKNARQLYCSRMSLLYS